MTNETNDTFTNDNSPDVQNQNQERPDETAVAGTTAFIEQYHDSGGSSAHRWMTGQIGSGITHPPKRC